MSDGAVQVIISEALLLASDGSLRESDVIIISVCVCDPGLD